MCQRLQSNTIGNAAIISLGNAAGDAGERVAVAAQGHRQANSAFVIDGANQVQGFAGWGLVTRAKAEAWVEGRYNLTYQDCLEGDCVVFNAWVADSVRVHRFLVHAARKLIKGKQTLYFKRHYKNGGWRAVRLNVNDFVGAHIDRQDNQTDARKTAAEATPHDGSASKARLEGAG